MRFGAIYGVGAVIGYTPQQVNEMSMWQFMAAVEGYRRAHSPEDDGMSSAEIEDVWAWMQAKDGAQQ